MAQDAADGQEISSCEWSIIIPAFNEEAHIQACLESICALACQQGGPEVVLVDNGSTDRTVAIAATYSERLNLKILQIPGATVGALRNAGAGVAAGKFFAFLDADCLARPYWLEHASAVLEKNPSSVAGAYYALPPDPGWPARLWHQRFHAGRCGAVSYLPGGNLMMERLLFWKIGGFDPKLRSNEDSQFCSRARACDTPILAFPELATIHLGAEKDLPQFIRRQVWHGSNVLSQAGIKGNIRAIGLAGYTLFCLFCAVPALLSGHFAFFVIAVGALLIPPVLMSLRGPRLKNRIAAVPLLIVLLTVYAVVRACVLPQALVRAIQQRRFTELAPQQ